MGFGRALRSKPRQRLLLVAHCFDAEFSMESRLSWFRATRAAKHFDTTLVCAEPFAGIRCDVNAQIPGLEIVTVPHTPFEKFLINTPVGFYLAYRLWHRRVFRAAKKIHAKAPFSLVHQVSYCGYREPGYCWRLGIPFVWGPMGGTQNTPWRFLSQFDTLGALKEAGRSLANQIQLRLGLRVGRALRSASAVFAANREVQQSFRHVRGVQLPCQLETGLVEIADDMDVEARPLRDPLQPLRILWVGRLESWKALPLLLKAVAQLPSEVPFELRIVGSGSRELRLKRMAEHLQIADRVDWVPLPDCGARDEHYRWADLFAFTSLRDTSGTGLLEALAAGTPVVGLDHQGARDIMTDQCAVQIAVESPQQVIAAFRESLMRLAGDSRLLQQLSSGALVRARKYHWDCLGDEMMACYDEVLGRENRAVAKRYSVQETPLLQTTSVIG